MLSAISVTPGLPPVAGPVLQYAGYGLVLVVFLLLIPRGIVPTTARALDRLKQRRRQGAVARALAG